MPFRDDHSFDKRAQLSKKIRENHPNKIPVIVEPAKGIELKTTKYIIGQDYTVGQFLVEIRKNIKVGKDEAIFLFCDYNDGQILVPISSKMSEIYDKYKGSDGFLGFTVCKEATFGYCKLL